MQEKKRPHICRSNLRQQHRLRFGERRKIPLISQARDGSSGHYSWRRCYPGLSRTAEVTNAKRKKLVMVLSSKKRETKRSEETVITVGASVLFMSAVVSPSQKVSPGALLIVAFRLTGFLLCAPIRSVPGLHVFPSLPIL